MAESLRTRLERFGFNFFPAYRGTGGRAGALGVRGRRRPEVVRRSPRGTGGNFTLPPEPDDPIYMMMLIKRLGPDFEVWDKAASIRFRRPGRSTLHASFHVDDALLAEIRDAVAREGRVERRFQVDLVDAAGEVHASCEKLLTIRRRERRAAGAGGRRSSTGDPAPMGPAAGSPGAGNPSAGRAA